MHATDDALELYALGLLEGKDLESIEEHLLICELCRSSLEIVDHEIAVLREGLRQHELEQWKNALQSKVSHDKVLIFKTRSGN